MYPKDERGWAHSMYKGKEICRRFFGNAEGMGSLGGPRHRWEESIKMDSK